jgi:MoaA/NifB/PqqE/SkfB family radical SAM enzyme
MEEESKSKEQLIKELEELRHRVEGVEQSQIEIRIIQERLTELRQLIQERGVETHALRSLIESHFQRSQERIEYVLLRLSFKERIKERFSKLRRKIVPDEKDCGASATDKPSATVIGRDQAGIVGEDETLVDTVRQIESLPLEIYIATNWECNYSCTYCFSYKPKDKSEFRKHNAIEWGNALHSIYQTYGKCRVTLTGGDPLLYKDAVDLVINATKYHYVSVGTNLSIGEEALRRIAKESHLENLFISSSYHLEHCPIDIFINKLMLLKSLGIGGYSSAVAYPEFIAEMPTIKNKFEDMGLGIAFYPYMGMYKGRTFPSGYSTEELSILRELPGWHLIINNDSNAKIELPRSKGILCYAGMKFIFVSPEGEVRRCVKVYQPLGNVFDHKYSLLEKPEPCPLEACDCEVSAGDCILPFTVDCFRQHQRFRLNQIR